MFTGTLSSTGWYRWLVYKVGTAPEDYQCPDANDEL